MPKKNTKVEEEESRDVSWPERFSSSQRAVYASDDDEDAVTVPEPAVITSNKISDGDVVIHRITNGYVVCEIEDGEYVTEKGVVEDESGDPEMSEAVMNARLLNIIMDELGIFSSKYDKYTVVVSVVRQHHDDDIDNTDTDPDEPTTDTPEEPTVNAFEEPTTKSA